MTKMTFEEFKATKEVLSLEQGLQTLGISEEFFIDSPTKGFLSYKGFYIELTPSLPTAYYLLLENADWASNDLESLEKKLYEYAVSVNFWD